jgi:hypothetical protein
MLTNSRMRVNHVCTVTDSVNGIITIVQQICNAIDSSMSSSRQGQDQPRNVSKIIMAG